MGLDLRPLHGEELSVYSHVQHIAAGKRYRLIQFDGVNPLISRACPFGDCDPDSPRPCSPFGVSNIDLQVTVPASPDDVCFAKPSHRSYV